MPAPHGARRRPLWPAGGQNPCRTQNTSRHDLPKRRIPSPESPRSVNTTDSMTTVQTPWHAWDDFWIFLVLFLGSTLDHDMIPCRAADRPDQQCVGAPGLFQGVRMQERAVRFPGRTVQQVFLQVDRQDRLPPGHLKYLERGFQDFGADPVPAQCQDLQRHQPALLKALGVFCIAAIRQTSVAPDPVPGMRRVKRCRIMPIPGQVLGSRLSGSYSPRHPTASTRMGNGSSKYSMTSSRPVRAYSRGRYPRAMLRPTEGP